MFIRKLLLCLFLISCKICCQAQEAWASPELEQMHNNVLGYQKLGNYKDAIITLNQLINLAPARTELKTELGNLYYLSGNYDLAIATLKPLLKNTIASDTTYQLLAACQLAMHQYKEANKTIKKGMISYGVSGMLYYRKGQVLMHDGDSEAAIKSWTEGVLKCPQEPSNYIAASLSILKSDNVLYGLLLGETYLAMRADTAGNDSLKTAIFNKWKTFFESLATKATFRNPMDDRINEIFLQLTPVVSDGITTENLTMLRTRFLLECAKKYSFDEMGSLLQYHDQLIRNGWFDIYNEWLFGKAGHAGQYEAWNKFHIGDIERFENWRSTHLLKAPPNFVVFDH